MPTETRHQEHLYWTKNTRESMIGGASYEGIGRRTLETGQYEARHLEEPTASPWNVSRDLANLETIRGGPSRIG